MMCFWRYRRTGGQAVRKEAEGTEAVRTAVRPFRRFAYRRIIYRRFIYRLTAFTAYTESSTRLNTSNGTAPSINPPSM
jgi:hypothetical protein